MSASQEITRTDHLYYYSGSDIANGSIGITTHDRRYENGGVGLKTLEQIEKYQVDVLGNYHKVTLPEKRTDFSKEG